ncbi:MAG TPA: antibiotic biosynthesis monooxygenase family protein [Terriglobales bacterium]|nr:antibiotic biosynthesis monooxygenase family protein [Terriglobales bacterium]
MAVKILIQRKIRPGRESEFAQALRELRSQAIHARGYISGETLSAIEDPSLHLVISTWTSLVDWNRWASSAERKAFKEKTDAMLEGPAKATPYQYESSSLSANEILTALESGVQDE